MYLDEASLHFNLTKDMVNLTKDYLLASLLNRASRASKT